MVISGFSAILKFEYIEFKIRFISFVPKTVGVPPPK